MMTKHYIFIKVFWGLILFQLIGTLTFYSKANASGGIEQLTPETKPTVIPAKPPQSVVNTINWENWGEAYWLNGSICRENSANTICLIPQQAQTLRWFMPANQESNQLSTRKK